MLRDPKGFAIQICSDIGVDAEECETELAAWSERVQDTNNERFVEAKTSRNYSRPDHQKKIGRWKENLSLDELRQVIPIVRDTAKSFDYVLPTEDF